MAISMALALARTAAVAVIAVGGLAAGTCAAVADDASGAPTGSGAAAPMTPPDTDWNIAPATNGDGTMDTARV